MGNLPGPVPTPTEPSGDTLKQLGMFHADAFAAGAYWDRVDDAILERAKTGKRFTSETIREDIGDPPDHPNAMGAHFHKAAKRGLILKVGFVTAKRAKLHAHPIAVWVGTPKAKQDGGGPGDG